MACTVYIDGVLIPTPGETHIERGSLSIEECIEERSVASFVVVDELSTKIYLRGMPVEIYDSTPTLIFAGFIDAPGRARLAPGSGLLHGISCMDNHYLADKRLVVKAYGTPGQTLADIVNDIWTDYLAAEGVIIGAIQTGPVIQSAIFNYVKVSDAFDALAELSGFTWFIDELKALYFIDRSTYASPWQLDSVTHRAIKGSSYLSTGNPLYRNRQYVRGGKGVTSLQTEHFTGDAIIKSFALGYPLALEPVITLTPGGVQTVGIKGIDTGEQFYWNKGDNTIYAEAPPGALVDIQVDYYGQYPIIAWSNSSAGQTSRQSIEGGGTGIVEEIVTESQHESMASAYESARAKIIQYCREAEKFIYQTWEAGLAPGQLQEITYAPFGFTAHQMLIESVSITADGETIYYNVSCITGPAMGSWAKFFTRLLTRGDNQIKIGDSLLLVLLQQSETLALAEATAYHTDDFSGGIVNRWIALPPAQGAGHNVEHEKVALVEAPALVSHDTEDYHWDDADMRWDFFTWA